MTRTSPAYHDSQAVNSVSCFPLGYDVFNNCHAANTQLKKILFEVNTVSMPYYFSLPDSIYSAPSMSAAKLRHSLYIY